MLTAARLTALTVMFMVAAATLTGCQTGRTKGERDALWVQNQELQDELNRTRAAKDAAQNELLALRSENQRLQQMLAEQPRVIEREVPAAARSGFEGIPGVETIRGAGTLTVRVPGDVLFDSGKVDLKQTAQQTLNQIAQVIQREHPNNTIRIEGYTDTDPIRRSGWKDNLELSLQRAAAVHRYLQTRGLSSDRMYAAGYGQSKPLDTKARSRRVEVVVELRE